MQRAYHPYIERIGRRPAPMDADYAERVAGGQVSLAEAAGVSGDVDTAGVGALGIEARAADGAMVGLIVLVDEADHLLVENVAVDPARQGEGIGRALLAHAEAAAREKGISLLRLYTNAAMSENLALYSHLGWRQTERRKEAGFERVFFDKRLG